MIRINPSCTKSDSTDRKECTQNSQTYSKITICIGIWHRYYLLKILHLLSNPTGFYLFTLDSWASLDIFLTYLCLSLDSFTFLVTGSHPTRLPLYFPSLLFLPALFFPIASHCSLSWLFIPALVFWWNSASRVVDQNLKQLLFAIIRLLALPSSASAMAHNEDCLHCSYLQAELKEIRA